MGEENAVTHLTPKFSDLFKVSAHPGKDLLRHLQHIVELCQAKLGSLTEVRFAPLNISQIVRDDGCCSGQVRQTQHERGTATRQHCTY